MDGFSAMKIAVGDSVSIDVLLKNKANEIETYAAFALLEYRMPDMDSCSCNGLYNVYEIPLKPFVSDFDNVLTNEFYPDGLGIFTLEPSEGREISFYSSAIDASTLDQLEGTDALSFIIVIGEFVDDKEPISNTIEVVQKSSIDAVSL